MTASFDPEVMMPSEKFGSVYGIRTRDSFFGTGKEFAGYLFDHAGLKPESSVLDVGCGPGRLATALTSRLSPQGRYDGCDVVQEAVTWCQERIPPHFPNFHFTWIDINNGFYQPKSKNLDRRAVLPYPNDSFDVVILMSVFTHMLPDGVQRYLAEIARVLKPGGRILTTFFLLGDDALGANLSPSAPWRFPVDRGIYRLHDATCPERAVAFQDQSVLGWLKDAGFGANPAIYRGNWPGKRKTSVSFQDFVVATKGS